MRAIGFSLALGATGLCLATAYAGTAAVPITVQVRLGASDGRGSCRSSGTDGQVTCGQQPRGVTTLDNSQQWSSTQPARPGSGSEAFGKLGGSPEPEPRDSVYGAYATSRVVTYGGIKFVEWTLNW